MARVSQQFAKDFDLVTKTWIERKEHTPREVEHLRQCLRVELSPGPGLPHPIHNGQPVKGWNVRTHEERIAIYAETFADWADQIRRDIERKERIKAEVRAAKERAAA